VLLSLPGSELLLFSRQIAIFHPARLTMGRFVGISKIFNFRRLIEPPSRFEARELTYSTPHYLFVEEHTPRTTMEFEEQLRSLEKRYDISESERARELGRTVAQLRD